MHDVVLHLLGLAAVAIAMLAAAWFALGEYRRVFRDNPGLVMSLEVFSVLAEIGSIGYLAALLAVCGAWMLVGAVYLSLSLLHSAVFP
jgi:hypothetical protein